MTKTETLSVLDVQQPNWAAIAAANAACQNNVNESKNNSSLFNLPEYRKTSDMEKFLYGFKELCKQCNMHTIAYSTFYNKLPFIKTLEFGDGSSIGIVRLFNECGFNIKTE